MKENKRKEVVDKAVRPEAQSQLRPSIGDKRKTLSKTLDLGNLPNHQERRRNMGRLNLGLSSLAFLRLSCPSKFLM